jgi:hypothetical protein
MRSQSDWLPARWDCKSEDDGCDSEGNPRAGRLRLFLFTLPPRLYRLGERLGPSNIGRFLRELGRAA